jgi:hypothetical protein
VKAIDSLHLIELVCDRGRAAGEPTGPDDYHIRNRGGDGNSLRLRDGIGRWIARLLCGKGAAFEPTVDVAVLKTKPKFKVLLG